MSLRRVGTTRRGLVAALLAASSLAAGGQEKDQASTFPAGVELVTVDALVLDKDDRPVTDLTAADFVIKEDGVVQKVESFDSIRFRESEEEERPSQVRVSSNAERRTSAERSFVIVFDDANISQYATPRARKELKRFIEEGLREGDHVTFVPTTGGPWWSGTLPEDREDLLAVVERLEGVNRPETGAGRISDYESMQISRGREPEVLSQVARRYYENGLLVELPNIGERAAAGLDLDAGLPLIRAKAEEQYRTVRSRSVATLETLERVARALTDLKGRKAVLLISEGFIRDPSLTEFRDFVRVARTANAVVYFVDARGLEGPLGGPGMPGGSAEFGQAIEEQDTTAVLATAIREVDGARSVAADTGGDLIAGNDLARGMRRVADEARNFYLLGYSSTNTKRDGKFRKISVSVTRPGLKVRARRGYYAPEDGAPRSPSPKELDPVVRAGLDAPSATDGIPLRLTSYVFGPAAGGKVTVLLVAEADPAQFGLKPDKDGRLGGTLESYAVVSPRDGGEPARTEKLIELSLPPSVHDQLKRSWLPIYRDFSLAPGVYQARLLVRSRANGRIGAVRHRFSVETGAGLRISTPILTDAVQTEQPPRPLPVAHRRFRSGARLLYAFDVYGAASDKATGQPRVAIQYSVKRADGTEFVGSDPRTVGSGPQGEMSQLLVVALQGANPGGYEVVLKVKDEVSGQSLEVRDPFEVVS